MIKRIIAILLVASALAGGLFYSKLRKEPLRVSGYLEADEIRLGSRVGGRVVKVAVEEGDSVKAGATLVELDPFDLMELRAQAAAQLAAKQADLEKAQAGYRSEEIEQALARQQELSAKLKELIAGPRKETIEAARARLAATRADLVYAQSNAQKIKAQFGQGVATQDELDKVTQFQNSLAAQEQVRKAELAELEAGTREEDIAIARAQVEQATQAYNLLKNGYRKEDIAAARSAVEAATAAMKVIDRQIEELKIKAPADGVIEAKDLKAGDLVTPNGPAMSMLDPRTIWVRAFVPENLMNLKLGQKVFVTVDSFPGRKFAARVTYVARQAEFTPNNVQTPEKRHEQVFRIKVTLDEGHDVLRAGMPADVWLTEVPK